MIAKIMIAKLTEDYLQVDSVQEMDRVKNTIMHIKVCDTYCCDM